MATLTPYQRDILIRTVAGEAMSESPAGQAAVVHTILNRAADGRWPTDPAKVALQPQQFSAWNKGAGGNALPYTIKPGSAAYEAIGQLVDGAASGAIADPTGGAVFYYAPKGMAGGKKPSWYGSANREGAARRLGNHIFLGRVGAPKTGAAAMGGVLKRGSKGEAVRALQQRLADAGLYTGRVDGDYGPRTQDAVRAYQMRYGLDADGIAGPQTQKSLAATATPTISPAGLYPPPQTEPPPVWPDSFNPPSGLNVGNAFPDTAAPFPGLPSLAPGSAPIAPMASPPPSTLARDAAPDGRLTRHSPRPDQQRPDWFPLEALGGLLGVRGQRPQDRESLSTFPARPEYPGALPAAAPPPPSMPDGFAAGMADYRPMVFPGQQERDAAPDGPLTAHAPAARPESGWTQRPDWFPLETLGRLTGLRQQRPEDRGMPSTFPARPEFPGALPGAAPSPPGALPPGFAAAMADYRPMMPDALTRSIDATTRRKAAMDQAMAEGAGQFIPNFDFATAPTPIPNDATRPPPWSDRALMMGPPVREDITTANSPFAAGLDALPSPPKPFSPDFEFTAGAGGDPSLAQWLERNGPNAPKATASGAPLDFLSGILPDQNLLRDLGLMSGGNEAAASLPPATRALPPPAAPPTPVTPAPAPQSDVWDPFNTRDYGKDQSRHPAMMGPGASLSPMGATRIPAPVMMADASGAWPALSGDAFNARFGEPAPPPSTFPGRPGIPGALPAAPSRSLPGVSTFPGPAGGIPAEPVVAPPVGDPMPISPPIAAGPPAPLPTPAPVKSPERKGLFGGPVGKAVLGLLGGIPGAAIGLGTGGKFGTNFASIFAGGPPSNNLFQSAGTSTSPNGMQTTFGTWGNTGQRAVQGPGGQTYVQQSDGTWAQAL